MAAPLTATEQRKACLERELTRITGLLVREYRPIRIVLFGSLAQDAVHEWSDLDLAIVKETDKRFIDRIGEVLELTQPTVGLEVVVYTPQEFDRMVAEGNYFVVDEILGKGKILYEHSQ